MRGVSVEWRVAEGEPVRWEDIAVTPRSRTLVIRLPFAGFVWNRPTDVVVQQAGQTRRVPVRDVTRLVQMALVGLVFIVAISNIVVARNANMAKPKESTP